MTGYPGSEEIERRVDALYEPVERLGAFLPVNRIVTVGPHKVEVVATLADCTTTAILYRSSREAMIWPDVVGPSEIGGSAHGTFWRDLHVHHYGPLQPYRDSVVVTFVSRDFGQRDEASASEPVILPIDRSRTAAHERFVTERPTAEVRGVRVRLLGGAVGVMTTLLELLVEATDPDALMLDFGGLLGGLMRHAQRGPGPAAFWREWHPESVEAPARAVSGPGGRWSVSVGSSLQLTARKVSPGAGGAASGPTENDEPEPELLRPNPGIARALPDGPDLGMQGSSGGGGSPGRGTSRNTVVSFGAPPPSSAGVELSLNGLVLFYFGSEATITVPGPRPGSSVDLSTHAFPWRNGRIELVSWRSRMEGGWMTHRLAVRPSDPGWLPDVRVLYGDASVSLGLMPVTDGTHRGGLPAMYNPILERAEVPLALRMVGVPSEPVRLDVPLTPARAPT